MLSRLEALKYLAAITGLSLAVIPLYSQAPPADQTVFQQIIVTDNTWKASTRGAPGWNTDDFNDTQWVAAEAPCSGTPETSGIYHNVINSLGFPTKALWTWSPGTPPTCFLRKHLTIPEGLARAEMAMMVDDNVKAYVNGVFVHEWDTRHFWGYRGCAAVVNLLPFLRPGKNIMAFALEDRGGAQGLAAEIRLNGRPFRTDWITPPPLPPQDDIIRKTQELIQILGADDWTEREKATKALIQLAQAYGLSLKPLLESSLKNEDPEIRLRLQLVLKIVFGPPEVADDEAIRQFAVFSLSDLETLMQTPGEKDCNAYRLYYSAGHLLSQNRTETVNLLARILQSPRTKDTIGRVLQMVDLLEVPELLPEIDKIMESLTEGLELVRAVSALARSGGPDELQALEKIAADYKDKNSPLARIISRTASQGMDRIKSNK